MSDHDDLDRLKRLSRKRPTPKALACPACSGPVELKFARLWRLSEVCGWDGERLAELKVEEVKRD
jgi:hypothetical protein